MIALWLFIGAGVIATLLGVVVAIVAPHCRVKLGTGTTSTGPGA